VLPPEMYDKVMALRQQQKGKREAMPEMQHQRHG